MKVFLVVVLLFGKVWFMDSKTGEALTGVRVESAGGVSYSDMDGGVFIWGIPCVCITPLIGIR